MIIRSLKNEVTPQINRASVTAYFKDRLKYTNE